MGEAGHGEQGSMLSPLLQTHELRVVCTSCYEQPHDGTSSTIHDSHLCARNILLARQRGGREADWRLVSPRPKFRNPGKYVKCLYTVEGGRCLQYGKRCTFAKSDEEAAVWNFLKNRRLEHSLLIRLVCHAQGCEEEEELGVAERIQSLFTGYFVHLCHTCFHSRPRQITPECPAKGCGHPTHPALVLFQVGGSQDEKVSVSEIRPIPPGLYVQQFRHCWYVEGGAQCRTECTFTHSEAEMAVWTAERNEGLDRNDLVTILEESEAQEVPRFHCGLCQLQFSSEDGFVSHCSSLAHERRYCEEGDPAADWKYRCPPNGSQALELCKRPETCEYGENCTAAHSNEELQEWCLRMRMIRRKRKAAQEQGLLSYRDQLLMEYRESLNEVLIRPLKAAALLKQEPGAMFTLGDSISRDPCAYSDGSLFCTLGTSYTLPVSFSSKWAGHYEQWLVLDFDTRPVLLRKIRVGVGEEKSFPELAEDRIQSGSPAPAAPPLPTPLRTEPWHSGNRIIVPCHRRTETEEELLRDYKPPRLNPAFNPAADSDVPLTRKNYRERMHSFLYREELAQEEVLSRLSLQSATVSLSDTITTSWYDVKVAPFRKLYASVPLSHSLTPHTPEGQLLRTAVGSALVAPSPSAKKKVYEALVLLEASTEDRIYLLLSRECCSDLSLRKDTSYPMDIQFQLNHLQFCEWHQAVDLLPDVERVLPDLIRGRVPEHTGDFTNLKLNAKQRAAVALIIGEPSQQLSTAPVLIYGPFGTGKTFTLATAIKELLRQPCTRVLICTHTNSSADLYVKDHFHQYVVSGHPEARPLRIKASKKGLGVKRTDDITRRYCLVSPDCESFLSPERSDLDSHRVVITTTSMARHLHDLKLPSDYFTHILIDEASQMLECAALIPLTLSGSGTRVVLAGDHMQTGPKLFSLKGGGSSSDYTLLNRLFVYYQGQKGEAASRSRVIFSENYRCTKEIVDFIAAHFYFGKVDLSDKGIKASGRVPPHPRFHPLRFHHIRGTCFWDKESMSWYNPKEATSVVEIVEELLKEWPPKWENQKQQAICVLSEGRQIRLIRRELKKKKLGEVIVETVHNVQGKQFRAILMTAVHTRDSLLSSNSEYPELFGDTRVLNTAMTRAQSLVVAVGDAPALCNFGKCSKIWKSYIKQCIDKGSASPEHITINSIEQEVREIVKFHKTEEGYNSDSESDTSKIEDPILQELLDEGNGVQVTITKEGLLEIIQNALSGDTTVGEDWSDTNTELLLRTKPHDVKRCKLIKETFDSGRHRLSGNWFHVQSDEGVRQGKGMSYDMVEELMIMYNSFVSEFLIDNEETQSLTPLKCQDCPDPKEVCQFLTRHSALMPFSAQLSHLWDENANLDNDNAKGQSADEEILNNEEDKADRETMVITKQCLSPESFREFTVFTSLLKRLEVAAQNRDFHTLVYLITADEVHPQLQPAAAEFRGLLQKSYIHRSKSTAQSKVGHHDLQLDSYTWASSPMRRYMDIIVQRLLHSALDETRPRVSQNDAIKRALEMPFSLIQGPPGTGKTVVGIHIVYWFFKRNHAAEAMDHHTHNKKGLNKKTGILYCGPSNKSVDIVAEQLLKLKDELKPLRVYSDQIEMLEFPYPGSDMMVCRKSLREEKPNKELGSITLRYLIRKPDNPYSCEIKSFEDRFGEEGISDDEIASYKKLLNEARQYELRKHDVVLCTCAAAQDPNFVKTMNFRQILIDECSMATEPEALIPLVAHKPEQIVLLGDHKQIQPIVQCNLVKTLGMKKSLFERYQESHEDLATMLDTQYRMHEDICKFPSETFYNGGLKTEAKRETSVLLSPSKTPTPILFGHVDGKEEVLVVSTAQGNENSTMNVEEAEQAVRIASLLISKSGIEPTSIAILTPYNAQMSKMNKILNEKGIKDVAVCTIMKSQGSEWRYVILSTVRSCPRSEINRQGPRPTKAWLSKQLGFITDPNQVNVAITRAQDGLCILGNQHLLKCNPLWEELLAHYQKHQCVVDPAKGIRVDPRDKSKSKRRK
ncbi:hypothetical protein ANANG_G00099040 [Anguilla anguilla]|uniref:C2H2-type domain-containing protein n=1 Tax=Anguilla anguilla TaxID=7936 RepID=A0A9D3MGE2_ANGAN|nr:hypothetical protein ANANG_G00099040 [Anguilla anguilla]